MTTATSPDVAAPHQALYSGANLRGATPTCNAYAMTISEHQELVEQVARLLEEVSGAAGPDFSGIGVIVAESMETLPIIALRPTSKPNIDTTTAAALADISHPSHEHHDGFHVLTPELEIENVAQYFSPPIISVARIDRQKRFGGRYLAALFGSMIPGVLVTGIASRNFGVAVFEHGVESYYRPADEPTSFSETTRR